MVVAGSEPLATTLTFLFYHLAKEPLAQEKLHAELESAGYSTEAGNSTSSIFLNGYINKTSRLHSPLPSGFLRKTPPEGPTIEGRVIPGNATVSTPALQPWKTEKLIENAIDFVRSDRMSGLRWLKIKLPGYHLILVSFYHNTYCGCLVDMIDAHIN